jgi:hypothetical protein
LVFGAAGLLAGRLEEPAAVRMEQLFKSLLIEAPRRLWVRLWPRG